ncbi:alpha/beta hydrolase [Devosia sp.]|uniref:alpha/beta hydrolase n=1 Tax=Devosia sp. TaxID=1871048 RepID=UPI001B2892C4|nr:alpha/beta hydrolase [Devosia sp.]MBO9590704.1 alpha/beta hydrolase [Devosia sp.]
MSLPRPALDPDLAARLAGMPLGVTLDAEILLQMRQYRTPVETYLEGRSLDHLEVEVETADGFAMPLSIFRQAGANADAAPCIYWVHGGGMVMGDRFANLDIPLEWLERFGAVVVTVDYRLAPEVSGSTLVEDCYQGLAWVAAHAADLGIDPARIIVAGASAGGGLAAGMVLMARDLGGPAISAQILICPMLDHRNDTISSRQYAGDPGVWTQEKNAFGWKSVLGGTGETEVSPYVSAARAADLSGLPTAYIDAGTAEVFRDENADYASRIWAAGGQAELHIWAGGFHGFDAMFPDAPLSTTARQARTAWLGRFLNAAA